MIPESAPAKQAPPRSSHVMASPRAKELRGKVEAIKKALSLRAPRMIYVDLAKMFLDLDDFCSSNPCLQEGFADQLKYRLEARALGLAAGKAVAPAPIPQPDVGGTAVTRDMMLAFDGKAAQVLTTVCDPVPEIATLYESLARRTEPFLEIVAHLTMHVASLLPKKTGGGYDNSSVAGLQEIANELDNADTVASRIFEMATMYHMERAQYAKELRKSGSWDWCHALILHDSQMIFSLRIFARDFRNNVCAIYDLLTKSEGLFKAQKSSEVARIMF